MRYTRVYWRTVAVLALIGLIWGLAYIIWRDYLPVRVSVDCGIEQVQRGEAIPMDQRNCLWKAYQNGQTARLVEHEMTAAGPRVTTLTLAGPGRVRMRWEATDEHGKPRAGRRTCERLTLQPAPPLPAYFLLNGCTGKSDAATAGYLGDSDPLHG